MTTNRKRLPSPALVVSVIALLFAFGGSAYAATVAANSVNTNSIVDGSVRSRDVRNQNLKGVDLASNSVGQRVLGPGSVSAEELAAVVTVTSTSAAVSDADGTSNGGAVGHVSVTATCPAGSDLIGGGAQWVQPSAAGTDDANVYVQEQYRSNGGHSWTADGIVDFGAQGNIRLQAQAYCLGAA